MILKRDCVQVIVFLNLFIWSTEADNRLESVQVIFRHGDRTPNKEEICPNCPHNPIYESHGYGQLTEVGKMREYRLGLMLRQRYNQLLGDTYRYGDIHAVSTDFDRTKMSLQLVVSGLYTSAQNASDKTYLSPVPATYMPEIVDTIMMPLLCPEYQKALILMKIINRGKLLKYANLFKYIAKNTGINMSLDPTLATSLVYQYLASLKSMNIPVPAWATEDVQSKIEEIVKLEYDIQSATVPMKRIYGGHLIKEFIRNMNSNTGNAAKPKMFLYSGHEVNVAAFAKAHDLIEPKIPLYGSAIMVEKWRNKAGKKFVRMLLWTGVTENLITYELPNCPKMCPYDTYVKLVEHVIPTDDESNCLWDNITKDHLRLYYHQKLDSIKN